MPKSPSQYRSFILSFQHNLILINFLFWFLKFHYLLIGFRINFKQNNFIYISQSYNARPFNLHLGFANGIRNKSTGYWAKLQPSQFRFLRFFKNNLESKLTTIQKFTKSANYYFSLFIYGNEQQFLFLNGFNSLKGMLNFRVQFVSILLPSNFR